MMRATSSHPLCNYSCHASPDGEASKSLRATGRLSFRFMTLERPDRAGRVATSGDLEVLDWICFGLVESGFVAIRPVFRIEPD
jgi:hypothetical protein